MPVRKALLPLLLATRVAWAYEGAAPPPKPPPDPPPAPKLTRAPQLKTSVPADYPPERLARREGGEVGLLVDISADGRVVAAEVIRSAGADFDEAARRAVLQYEFEPALLDDRPAAVRLEYRYVFEPPPPPPPPNPLELPVNLRGRVLQRGTREPVPGASVWLPGPGLVAETGADGRFELRGVPLGRMRIEVSEPRHRKLVVEEDVREGEVTELTAYLGRRVENGFEATVRAERERTEVARRTLDREELTTVPGTFGDPVRVLQNLPGMARAPYVGGQLLVRGGLPGDTGVMVDGVPVPLLFHFAGGPSVLSPSLVDRIDFLPGAYGARYGRAIAGIVDVGTRRAEAERLHGDVSIDLLNAAVYLEGPVPAADGNAGSWAVAARRSYLDAFLPSVLDGLRAETAAAVYATPYYWDYQARYDVTLAGNRLSLLAFGSYDRLFASVSGTLDASGVTLDTLQTFHRVRLGWSRDVAGWRVSVSPTVGRTLQNFDANSELSGEAGTWDLDLRASASRDFGEKLSVETGLDAHYGFWRAAIRLPELPAYQTFPGSTEVPPVREHALDATLGDAALYAEAVYRPFAPLKLVPGLRLDVFDLPRGATASLEPRFTVRWEARDGTTLKAAWGVFRQAAQPQDLHPEFGNPDLGLERSLQHVVGVEQRLRPGLLLDVQGYYNLRDHLVAGSSALVERDGRKVPERLNNSGRGRAYGLEVLLKQDVTERLYGWVSYTLSRALRHDFVRNIDRPAGYDQTHNLVLVGSYRWNGGWETGLRFRLTTGRPETPITGATFDADTGGYRAAIGEPGSARGALFHQLDLRAEKTWTFELWRLSTYLDLQNVYNAQNPEALLWDYRYAESAPLRGLPILPTLGVRGAF